MRSAYVAPSMYLAIDTDKRIIVVEPSFPISQTAAYEVEEIHTVYHRSHQTNRISVSYTFGYELHETLAAIVFTLVRCGLNDIPVRAVRFTGNKQAMAVLPQVYELAVLMDTWSHLAAEVQANEQLVAEIDKRAETYDEDARRANLVIKAERQRAKESEAYGSSDWFVKGLNESLAKRRLIATNKRCDPARKAKAQQRLNELEAEIRALRPTWRRLVRSELQAIV